MATDNPVYILIHHDGVAEWGSILADAEASMGYHGVSKGPLTPDSRLRVMMSDCAMIMPEVYVPNPYATSVLARVAAVDPLQAPQARGAVALFGYDPYNDWDSTRPFTDHERDLITRALTDAGCTVN